MCGSSSTIKIFVFISVHPDQWNPQTETASAALARFINHVAAVRAGDLPRNRQAQPGTLDAAAQGIVRAIKFLKHFFLAAARHARTAIQHLDFGVRQRRLLLRHLQRDFLPAVGIFFRVRKKIDDDLRQRIGIAANGNRRGGQVAIELESTRFQMRTKRFGRGADNVRQVARLEVVFLFAAFHARKIKTLLISRVSRAASAVMMCR